MATSSGAVPPQSFTLDCGIFNAALYTSLRSVWFAGLPENATTIGKELGQRWFGASSEFDDQCRAQFGPALASISPSKLALPPFKSYEDQLTHAAEISAPLLSEVRDANAQDPKSGAETLLSLVLLLDQMPRNIHRDPAGLRLVYNHYDRLAWSLVRASQNLTPNPTAYPGYLTRPAYAHWCIMPLMHAEDLTSHALAKAHIEGVIARVAENGDEGATEFARSGLDAQEKHTEIVERFGRYPHRNECLGRATGPEEVEWLKTGDTFGVKQVGKEERTKDEL